MEYDSYNEPTENCASSISSSESPGEIMDFLQKRKVRSISFTSVDDHASVKSGDVRSGSSIFERIILERIRSKKSIATKKESKPTCTRPVATRRSLVHPPTTTEKIESVSGPLHARGPSRDRNVEYPPLVAALKPRKDTLRRSIKLILLDEDKFESKYLDAADILTDADSCSTDKDIQKNTFVTISWFEGTTVSDLWAHVGRSVSRKLSGLASRTIFLDDMRITDGNEEIVLTPHVPHESTFYLVYKECAGKEELTKPQNIRGESPTPSQSITPSEKQYTITVLAQFLLVIVTILTVSSKLHEIVPPLVNPILNTCAHSIETCAHDEQTLFTCMKGGEMNGLLAGICLWIQHLPVKSNIFLLGFESPKKMWIVLYEAIVSSVCWGACYLYVRRGMNPATRDKYFEKYWRDTLYGSMAGLTATFMKAVLKNFVNKRP